MKKICLFIICIALAIAVKGQTHMRFMGLPIDGSVVALADKLEQKGFEKTEVTQTDVVLKGKFTDRDVEVHILGSQKTRTAWKVVVAFEKTKSWIDIYADYYYYKNLFIKKYGEPESVFEKFKSDNYEGKELLALKEGMCYFLSFWEAEGGCRTVRMSNTERLILCYEDDFNCLLKNQEDNEMYLEEI